MIDGEKIGHAIARSLRIAEHGAELYQIRVIVGGRMYIISVESEDHKNAREQQMLADIPKEEMGSA